MQRYLKRAKELESEIVENRRKIHQFGGIGFDIQETSDFVFEKLQSYGLHPQRMCGTGIVCTIGSGGKTILLRADMDALPIQEDTGLPFACQNGTAHACGHDMHTAMLLAAAKMLSETQDELKGTVKLMFQPAEEALKGATAMMEARGHIDVLVPRGGAGLIQAVVRNSKVPVIETGAGNVHIYIDKSGDLAKAILIIINAKTQRVGVCNAAEKLLVHKDVAAEFLPQIAAALAEANVVLQADTTSYDIISGAAIEGLDLNRATEEDWDTEYLALKMGIKVVPDLGAAIDHINTHSTGHTESIIAEDYAAIEEFAKRIDSAVVMVNASTRFTDGGVFGFGAELGISTQKMHARGPMGLREMTTTKWIGYGTGQVRA